MVKNPRLVIIRTMDVEILWKIESAHARPNTESKPEKKICFRRQKPSEVPAVCGDPEKWGQLGKQTKCRQQNSNSYEL